MGDILKICSFLKLYYPKRFFWAVFFSCKFGFNLYALLRYYSRLTPHKIVLDLDDQQISYSELLRKVIGYKKYLSAQVPSDKNIGIVLSNGIDLIVAVIATSLLDNQTILISPKKSRTILLEIFEANNLNLLISEDKLHQENITQLLLPRYISEVDSSIGKIGKGNLGVLSSGTSGVNKTISRKMSAKMFLGVFVDLTSKLNLTNKEINVVAVPMYHGYGLASWLMTLILGKQLLISAHGSKKMLGGLERLAPSVVLSLIPYHLDQLIRQPITFPEKTHILVGGAPLVQSILDDFKFHYPKVKLSNLYGTTESGVCFCELLHPSLDSNVSIGFPLKYVKVNWPTNEENVFELKLKSPWANSKKWIATGDIVQRMENGKLKWLGRMDNMIVSGGMNIFPSELEEIVRSISGVADVRAFCVKDHKFYQKLGLQVQFTSSVYEDDFYHDLEKNVPIYLQPASIEIVNCIERNELGK